MSSESVFLRGRTAWGQGVPVSPIRQRKTRRRWARQTARTTAVALGLLGGAVLAHAGWSFLHNDGAFGVREIHVIGLQHHAPQILRDALADLQGRNLFALGPQEISQRFAAFPWLSGFLCRKHLPDTLIVEVVERRELCTVATDRGPFAIDGSGMAWQAPSGTPVVVSLVKGLEPADTQVQAAVAQLLEMDLRGAVTAVAPGDVPGTLTLVCPDGWRLRVSPSDLASQWRRFTAARAWAATYAPGQKALDLRWAGKVVLLPAPPASDGTGAGPATEGGSTNG